MLVDGAKFGDVEIPVFCYEPKLGQPVGACRMCLVEIEGIPKLQTACSTPVKDGMVVHTQTERVKTAQQAVVEFLLINHPLDCPVCDKGGECPLQDISFGWGGGRSRFIEPKRHFEKPLALSPLVAIDRERCILCYRCVRFSQEVSEDYQLVFQERGAHTFVGTFDGHPYVAPFSGNIVELCPVGALTSQPYRFRARPWDIEGAGGVCTLCPAQCNVTFPVRDERVLRVLGRDHTEVDDGWLCDKGRFAYQSIHVDERITRPMVRDGGDLRPVPWEVALERAAGGLARAKGSVGAVVGGETTNEEGFLVGRIMREALESANLDSQRWPAPADAWRALGDPARQAAMTDIEWAHAVLVLDVEPVDAMPILDLRIRKGVRRNRVRLAVATSRPSTLDPNAEVSVRFGPAGGAAFAGRLAQAMDGASNDASPIALMLREAGDDLIVVCSERVAAAAAALLGLRARLLVVPSGTNGRGLREAGVLPDAGPGLASVSEPGLDAAGIRDGGLGALWLVHTDPLLDLPGREAWERALAGATTVVAHAGFLSEGLRAHADVVFPAESYAEKDGTVTHPDGRVQRLRPAIGHQGETRFGWQVLNDLAKRLGLELGVLTSGIAFKQLTEAVPVYAGLTLDELGGKGVRWVEREQASSWPSAAAPAAPAAAPPAQDGRLRFDSFRSLWATPEVLASPALAFLHPGQRAEVSAEDARRLGLSDGDNVRLATNGTRVDAVVRVRGAVPTGTVFVEEPGANALTGATLDVEKA